MNDCNDALLKKIHSISISSASGADYYQINPKGNVPALVLKDGTLLNEVNDYYYMCSDSSTCNFDRLLVCI